MTTIINASTVSGLVNSADTSGILQLQTASTAALTIDASQNVGIGVASSLTGKLSVGTVSYGQTSPVAQVNGASKAISNNGGILSIGSTDAAGADIGGSLGFTANSAGNGYATGQISGRKVNGSDYSSYMAFTTCDSGGTLTEKMRINSAGQVGVGATSSTWSTGKALEIGNTGSAIWGGPSLTAITSGYYYNGADKYAVTGGYAMQYQMNYGNGAYIWYSTAATGNAGDNATVVERMRLDPNGYLSVTTGMNVSGSGASVAGVGATNTMNGGPGTGSWGLAVQQNTTSGGGGRVLGLRNVTDFNNASNEVIYYQGNATARFYVLSNGGIYNYSANNVNLSDRREKTNFSPSKSYLDVICAIPVQTFNYIDQNMEEDGGLTLGVVAQDVQAVAPELVKESNWGTQDEPKMRLSIYQTDLQYALMKSIQELKAINDTQAETINALTARIVALESKA